MLRKITSFCVAVLLTLSSVDAAQSPLNTLDELKNCHLYKQTNILELLRWFADTVNFENNIIQLTFNPCSDYGSHRYRNDERILAQLPPGYQYYTVGNINRGTSRPLPPSVVNTQRRNIEHNKARIIFRVRENGQTIDQVYITQHLPRGHGSTYDQDHTYRVTTNLLRAQRRHTAYDMVLSDDSVATLNFGNESNANTQIHSSNRDGYMLLNSRNYSNQDDCNWGICCGVFGCLVFIIICIALGIYFGFGRK